MNTNKIIARRARNRVLKRIIKQHAEAFVIVLVLTASVVYFGWHFIAAIQRGSI